MLTAFLELLGKAYSVLVGDTPCDAAEMSAKRSCWGEGAYRTASAVAETLVRAPLTLRTRGLES